MHSGVCEPKWARMQRLCVPSTVTVIFSSDSEEPLLKVPLLLSERVSELSTMPQLFLLGGLPAES